MDEKRTFGISHIVQSTLSKDEQGKYLPFGTEFPALYGVSELVDGKYPYWAKDKAQVELDIDDSIATIRRTRGYDGIYGVRRVVERRGYGGICGLERVVDITCEKDGIEFSILCDSEIIENKTARYPELRWEERYLSEVSDERSMKQIL